MLINVARIMKNETPRRITDMLSFEEADFYLYKDFFESVLTDSVFIRADELEESPLNQNPMPIWFYWIEDENGKWWDPDFVPPPPPPPPAPAP